MLVPQWDSRLLGPDIVSSPIFELGIRRCAALMIGWTVLLVWADRRPVERSGVLVITICPVMLGYIGYLGYALLNDFASLGRVVPSLIIEVMFIVLFMAGYLNARKLSAQQKESNLL